MIRNNIIINNPATKKQIVKIILTVALLIISCTMIVPLLWMISTSLKVESDVFNFPIEWIPKRWNAIKNYTEVWGKKYNFALFYLNSIKVTVLTTVCQVFISALGAYGFSKVNFKFRDSIFLLYLATIMIPEQVTIVPRFMLFKWLNLFDTHLGLILMGSFSVYGVFLLRQFMVMIPESLSQSAKIDGASHFRIFMQIILPIAKPAVVTLAILKFVWTWNDYQNPLIFLNSRKLFTLQLGMKQFASESGEYYSLVMAGAVSAIIPLIIVFLIGQKHIIDGITIGAVKG